MSGAQGRRVIKESVEVARRVNGDDVFAFAAAGECSEINLPQKR